MGRSMESMKTLSWPRRLLNIGGVIFLSLIVLELGLRLLAVAFAERPTSYEQDSGEGEREPFTIVCIGDSWTRGQPSGSYPAFLQRRLEAINAGTEFRVVNLGNSGTNSTQALRRLADAIPRYQPRMAIVMSGNKDHSNLTESAYWRFADSSDRPPSLLAAKTRVFLHSLRVYRVARLAYCALAGIDTPNQFLYLRDDELAPTGTLAAIDADTHRRQLEYNLVKFVELTRSNGIELVFQTYFHFHGFQVNQVILDVATAYRIPVANHNLNFHTEIPVAERPRYLIPDGHPSPLGYDYMAAKLLEVIQENGLL